ncbi:hypothetical protein [Rubritalea marina]|uniref:hypothetical protein n=1 Tax=Rubritalea marina TaxID=361055 RepID=UPI00037C0AF7|nr:hypothetical protein [Rubritalea marina]
MPAYIYNIIHVVGIILIFMGFAYGMKQWSKGAAISHGLGLALTLISGFAMVGGKFPMWFFIKLAIWLALGGTLTLVKRKKVTGLAAWIMLVTLGAAAAWTVYHGRFIMS